MPRRRTKRALVIVALALTACRSPAPSLPSPAQPVTLYLHATAATAPLLHDLIQGYGQSRPEWRLLVQVAEAPYHVILDAAASPDAATRYGLVEYLPADSALWAAPVGREQIALIAHPHSGITDLALGDLRAIYAGRVVNWSALGGPDLPVTAVTREAGSPHLTAFRDLVMGSQPITRNARLAASMDAMARIVAETPGAIGYLPLASLPPGLSPLRLNGILPDQAAPSNEYPLTTALYFVGPGEPDGALRDFIAWVQSAAGQAVVSRAYSPMDFE